jgi:gluconate 5-dehydrogenase
MSTKLFDLTGKNALVTGATHGIGMALATALAEAGATIIVNDVFLDKLKSAKQEYASNGIDIHTYVLDVTDEEAVESTIPVMEEEVGPIDILVNNAGIIKRIPILEMKADEFRQVLDVNLTGQFIMAKAVAKGMVARRQGKIMLTRNMATEWARHNIQINGIGPGYIATSQTEPLRVDGHPFNDFIIQRTPAGRWGDPEDLAGTAIFLASRASDFVNGHILYVDGGILATIGKPANEE